MLGNKEIMAKNIQYFMDQHEKTRNDVCNDLGFKYSTFSDWINGKKYPRIDKIEMMANYFHISKSDLVEDHSDSNIFLDNHSKSQRSLTPDESDLLGHYQKLNDYGKEEARKQVRNLTRLDEYKKGHDAQGSEVTAG